MSEKTRHINAAGHQPEPVLQRAQPVGRADRAARESKRRASAYGRARGNA